MTEGEIGNGLDEFSDALVEEFAPGIPRMAARMLVALVLTDSPALSSRELAEQLGASAASISNMGRLLIRLGVVERTVDADTRRDIYRLRSNAWPLMARGTYDTANRIVAILTGALNKSPGSEASVKVRDMRNFYDILQQQLTESITRYEDLQRSDIEARRSQEGEIGSGGV